MSRRYNVYFCCYELFCVDSHDFDPEYRLLSLG
jgi:hypothetical protein